MKDLRVLVLAPSSLFTNITFSVLARKFEEKIETCDTLSFASKLRKNLIMSIRWNLRSSKLTRGNTLWGPTGSSNACVNITYKIKLTQRWKNITIHINAIPKPFFFYLSYKSVMNSHPTKKSLLYKCSSRDGAPNVNESGYPHSLWLKDGLPSCNF